MVSSLFLVIGLFTNLARFFNEISIYGATDPIRTGDLLITSELLYRLSHSSRYKNTSLIISLSCAEVNIIFKLK